MKSANTFYKSQWEIRCTFFVIRIIFLMKNQKTSCGWFSKLQEKWVNKEAKRSPDTFQTGVSFRRCFGSFHISHRWFLYVVDAPQSWVWSRGIWSRSFQKNSLSASDILADSFYASVEYPHHRYWCAQAPRTAGNTIIILSHYFGWYIYTSSLLQFLASATKIVVTNHFLQYPLQKQNTAITKKSFANYSLLFFAQGGFFLVTWLHRLQVSFFCFKCS